MSSSRTSPDYDGVAPSFPPVASGGQNNPAALRQALRAAISPDDITAIAEILREMALDGNLSAIRLLLSYVVGRPGAPDQDDAEPESPPTPAPAPEGPAPAQTPGKNPPPVCAAASEPRTPAPPASPSPSVTAIFSARFFIPAGGVCVGVYRRGMPQPLWASLIDCGGRFRARGKRPPLFPLAQPKSTSIVLLSLEFPRHHSLDSAPAAILSWRAGLPFFLPACCAATSSISASSERMPT